MRIILAASAAPTYMQAAGVLFAGAGLLLIAIVAVVRLAWRHLHECDGCGFIAEGFGPWRRVHRSLTANGWTVEFDGARMICPTCTKDTAKDTAKV